MRVDILINEISSVRRFDHRLVYTYPSVHEQLGVRLCNNKGRLRVDNPYLRLECAYIEHHCKQYIQCPLLAEKTASSSRAGYHGMPNCTRTCVSTAVHACVVYVISGY